MAANLRDCRTGIFDGLGNGSIGFMAVFDDLEKLKAAYPDSDVTFAERRD